MPTSVTMPALGESVTEGTVTRWLKQEGEQVEADEPLLEVSTDKVDTEIPSPAAGILTKILVAEDETVDVGAELAVIGGDGDGGGDAGSRRPRPRTPDTAQTPDQQVEDAQPRAAGGSPPRSRSRPRRPPPAESGSDGGGGGGGEGTPVTMPALGESVTEGTVTRWLKAVGDEVAADEPLLEVSTDKVDTEIPSPVSGTLLEITVDEDETVDVGAQLAVIGSGSGGGPPRPAAPAGGAGAGSAEAGGPAPQEKPQAAPEAKPAAPADGPARRRLRRQRRPARRRRPPPPPPPQVAAAGARGASSPPVDGGGAYVTPLVRKLAAEHGVDLARSPAPASAAASASRTCSPRPRRRAAPAGRPARPPARRGPRRRPPRPTPRCAAAPRRCPGCATVIARRMVESLQVSAQLTTVVEVDVTRDRATCASRPRSDFEAREGVKLSFLPFFAKAAVEALKAHPR